MQSNFFFLRNRNFLTLLDFTEGEIKHLLQLSKHLKWAKRIGSEKQKLKNKNIALIFEKTSTRTRCSFEVACFDQGANVTYLSSAGSQIGHKESIADTARVLGRFYNAIEYRGAAHSSVEELAKHAGVPVYNGLTDDYHPTQFLADALTMEEHERRKRLSQMKLCFLGDTKNNVANSLMIGCAKLGIEFWLCGPKKYAPDAALWEKVKKFPRANLHFTENLEEAVRGADYLYTDVWVSMGEPEDLWKTRIDDLMPYQVNKNVLALSNNPRVKFLHCLPAFHNTDTKVGQDIKKKFGLSALEVTEEVFESSHSLVFDQAENRLHTIKAILVATLG